MRHLPTYDGHVSKKYVSDCLNWSNKLELLGCDVTVSYTHLTLPTTCGV